MLAEAIRHRPLFAAVASGVLLVFSFPKFGVGALAWVALVPLLLSLPQGSFAVGFLSGLAAGFVAELGLLYWIAYVVVTYGFIPLPLGIIAAVAVAAYLSLYWGLFGGALSWLGGSGAPRILVAPVLFTSLEFAKSQLLTGFPWENLGHSQYLYPVLTQIADTTGVYGITFMIVMVNAALADCLDPAKRIDRRFLYRELAAVAALLAGVAGYGALRLAQLERLLGNAERMAVTLSQGNIDQSVKWDPFYQYATIAAYRSISPPAQGKGPCLLVWPETAVPCYFQEDGKLRDEVLDIVRASGSYVLFGSPAYDGCWPTATYFNSAYLLSPAGDVLGRYDKVHLVPYGEYVPLRRFLPFLSKIVVGIGDLGTGKGFVPLTMGTHRLGTLICYEAIFPEAGRSYKTAGADLLVNITNDAWFGRTSAPWQHLSMTVFRAIENRLYLVRAANTGVSAIIDPVGRIIAHTALFERTALRGEVRFIHMETFYARRGDVFVMLCLATLAVLILDVIWRRRRSNAGRNRRVAV